MRKRTSGKKGEQRCQQLVEGVWDARIVRENKDERYDFMAELPNGDRLTFEVKTNPQAITKYGGFSVEIGHRYNTYITSYLTKEPFLYEGIKVVSTGLMTSEADWYIFHDDKKQYYFIKKQVLMDWVKDIWKNQHHRVVWGGFNQHTLQIQIRISELQRLGNHIDLRKSRGRKPKVGTVKES